MKKNYQNLTGKRLIALVRELAVKQAGQCRTTFERLKFPAFGERERQDIEKSPHAIRIFDRENLRRAPALSLLAASVSHAYSPRHPSSRLVALWEDCVNSVSCCGRVHNARIEKV